MADLKGEDVRIIIYGLGAVGGTMAVELTRAGHKVIGIARGAQLDAIKARGLTLKAPDGEVHATFEVVAHPSEIRFLPDDVICLTMKTQHTEAALADLRAAGVRTQTIACVQNGVTNERLASRYFDHVLGVMIDLPTTFLIPGEVVANNAPRRGLFYVGAYPTGMNGRVSTFVAAIGSANFVARAHPDVMRTKYGKLLINVANGIDPVLGPAGRTSKYMDMAVAEAKAVFAKANIGWDDVTTKTSDIAALIKGGSVAGVTPVGSSAAQSIARGAGSVEVDYLNGEIALLGRLHGMPTPVNAFFCDLSQKVLATGAGVGSMTEAQVDALFLAYTAESML